MPKVSIVLPIYNVEDYLEQCLESLRNQTMKDIEFLCINDGSQDHSQDIIAKFCALDSRFIGYTKPNGGLSDARNFGLKKASADYIMFIDSDDFVSENMAERCYQRMIQDDLDMVVFDYTQYSQNSQEVIKLPFNDQEIYEVSQHKELFALMNNAAWNKMYRTSLFTKTQIEYPFGYRHQDLGTTFRLMLHMGKIGFIHEPLYHYRLDRPNNISQKIDKKIYHILDMVQINIDYFKERGVFGQYQQELTYLSEINLITALRKCVKLTDRKFAFEFMDKAFSLMKDNFKSDQPSPYNPVSDPSDKIYLSKLKCKLYYYYRQMKGR